MEFFIAWTDSDPEYQLYDGNCSLLLSPPVFSRAFRATRLQRLPKRLLIDSGAYTLRRQAGNRFTQADLFNWQMTLLEGVDLAKTKVLLSHLDDPLDPGLAPSVAYQRMESTLARAWDFLSLAERSGLRTQVELIGVIQGYDLDSIRWSAREMKRLGFHRFGLGSLAMLYNPLEIARRVQAAVDEIGTDLHLFGITSVRVLRAVRDLGVASIDSARPVKEAMFYVLLYSEPFRRYALAGHRREDMGGQQLADALPCDCPICRDDPTPLFQTGAKRYTNARAIHNYFHLKQAICGPEAWREPTE